MDISIAKGLVGLACFIQTQGGEISPGLTANLTDSEIRLVETIEGPCLELPDDLDIIFDDEVGEDFDKELASGEPTMTLGR